MPSVLIERRLLLEDMRKLDLEVLTKDVEARIASLRLQPSLLDRIKQAQSQNPEREGLLKVIGKSEKTKLCVNEHGIIRYAT